ncbi:MAG: NTP transferase domain-containing protein [Pirellulales bacterium]|nr:NTP transferase domain-containing protein [Pirellulales bacterium]
MNTLETDKLVVLARGLGTRMRKSDDAAALDARQAAAAETGVKALIPIDRPFLDYVLSAAADAGLRRVCLVIGPEHHELREYYTEKVKPERLTIEFAVQVEPKGTADAVAAAERFAAAEPFVMINSDNYYPVEALRALRQQTTAAVALFEQEAMLTGSNVPAERIKAFAVGRIDGQGLLERILEKPDAAVLAALPRPLWVSMNCWRFGPKIFEACRSIGLSPRGELELTAAVQYAIDALKEPFHAVLIRAAVLDLSRREDVAAVAQRLKGTEVRL